MRPPGSGCSTSTWRSGRPARVSRSGLSPRPTTCATSMAGRVTTVSPASSPPGISRCPGVTRATRRTARRSAGSATPRTACSSPTSATTAPRPSPPRSRSSGGCGSAGCGRRWCRPAATWSPCWRRPGCASCSTPRSTGSRPTGWGWPASPTRRCSWRRPVGSGWRRRGPRSSRTPWPGWRRAAGAGSGWSSGWTGAARPPPWPSGAPTWSSPTSGSSRSKVIPCGRGGP